MSNCHCGNELSFENCCMPIIQNLSNAKTAEELMRARYSSYVTSSIDFLRDSLHPDSRSEFEYEETKSWAENSKWHGLKIIATKAGQKDDKTGVVDFIAKFSDESGVQNQHCERSQFKRINQTWFFCDGQTIVPEKIGRNDPCSCGSGIKFKKCCG